MTTTIRDVSGERRLTIEADNPLNPTSVFVIGPSGLTIEFDRMSLLRGVARELGLVDPLDVLVAMPGVREVLRPCKVCAAADIHSAH